jgi:hypothetical protein
MRARLTAVLVLGALAALLFPASSPAALKMIWGPNTLPDGQSAFPVYQSLGVDVLERELPWSDVAPTRPKHPTDPKDPAYHWPASVGAGLFQAVRSKISFAVMVRSTPNWANGGRGVGYAPTRPKDYADFMKAASRRYKSVKYWMVWGEPTRKGNFEPMSNKSSAGTRRYARLLDAAYSALKFVDSKDVVIGGMTWTLGVVAPPKFLKWLRLPNGRPPRLDMWGHNPFSRRFPSLGDHPYYPGVRDINDVDTLETEVRRTYARTGRKPKLWLSEFTISSDRANRGYDFFVSRDEQAQWITAAYKLADSVPYVAGLGWYSLFDDPATQPDGLTTGLMTNEGEQKPAFAAYQRVAG